MAGLPSESLQFIYLDPPFNTGKVQRGRTVPLPDISGGTPLDVETTVRLAYTDSFQDYTGFLVPRLIAARRLLDLSGTLAVHCDQRESHYIKVALDVVFGRNAFLSEVIWAYDWGGRARDRWPAKHDTILLYARTPGAHYFDDALVDRIPYLAPGWQKDAARVAAGKRLTDVWWHTIVPVAGRERTGYPTQKPEGVLRRFVLAHSRPGDAVGDFFAGSGTLGAVAAETGRRFVLADSNPQAVEVMRGRLPAGTVFTDTSGGSC